MILADFKAGRLDLYYGRMYPGLLVWTRRLLGEKKAMYAEDLLQNAVFKAWERRDTFDSFLSFKAFLYVTLRNEILNLHRSESSHARYVSQLEDPEFVTNSIIDNEARSMLFNAINALPEKQRQVITLSYIEGLTNQEIEQRLGMSLATVKRYKARSLDAMREHLDIGILVALAFALACTYANTPLN